MFSGDIEGYHWHEMGHKKFKSLTRSRQRLKILRIEAKLKFV